MAPNAGRSSKMLPVLVFLSVVGSSSLVHANFILVFLERDDREIYGGIEEAIADEENTRFLMRWLPLRPNQRTMNFICGLGRPDLILDFTSAVGTSEFVKQYSAAMWIPTISTSYGFQGDVINWKNLTNKQKKFLVRIHRPEELVPSIVRNIVVHQNYSNAGIIYDRHYVMFHQLKRLLVNLEVRHSIRKFKRFSIKALERLQLSNVFVIGSIQTIAKIFTEACSMNLFIDNYSFHGITLENGTVSFECHRASFIIASPIGFSEKALATGLKHHFHFEMVNIGVRAARHFPILEPYNDCDNYQAIPGSIVPDNLTDLHHLLKGVLNDLPLVFNITRNGSAYYPNFEMQLSGVTIYEDEIVQVEHIGIWSSSDVANLRNAELLKEYSAKRIFHIAVAVQEPFAFPDENSRFNYSGFCIDLIYEISLKMHFSFRLYTPPYTGYRDDFNQAINDVERGTANLAIGSISATSSRNDRVAFTIPFYETVGNLIMMKIPEASKSFFKIIDVFHLSVWFLVAVVLFLTSVMLWIFDRWSPYSYQNNKEKLEDSEEKRIFTFRESLWFSLNSVTSLGGGEVPRTLSGRILVGTWWLFGFMILSSYSAILSAFLTASNLDPTISSLDDLNRQYRVKYGVINGSAAMSYFKDMAEVERNMYRTWLNLTLEDYGTVEIYDYVNADYPGETKFQSLLQYMQDTKSLPSSLEEAISKVQASTNSDQFALIGDASDIRFAMLTNCDLQSVGEEFAKRSYAFALKRGSNLKEDFDNALIDLLNDRILEQLKNKWWRDNPKFNKHCDTDKYQADGITIQNVTGVFTMIAAGIVISVLVICADNWLDRRKALREAKVEVFVAPPSPKMYHSL